MTKENVKALPKREEVDPKHTWDLTGIYKSDEEWEAAFGEVEQSIPKLEALKGKLSQSSATFLQTLKLRDELQEKTMRVYVYTRLKKDQDSTNSHYVAYNDRATSLVTKVQSAISFITPEILDMNEETIEQFLAAEEGLKRYAHALDEVNRRRAHVLSSEEEAILAQAGDIAGAPGDIFSMINDADIQFPSIKNEHGEEIELTHGRYIQLMESKNQKVRQDAFQAMYSTYRKQNNTLAATLNAGVKKNIFYSKVRKYNSALEASLHKDNIPVEVYHNLISTIHEHFPVFYRYMELRRKMLDLDQHHLYDIFAPLVKEVDMRFSYEEAKEVIRASLKPLGEEYLSIVDEGFSQRWIDVYENRGKRSGAYSFGTYGTPPYIMMNYQDNLNNVYTLTHEMGHSVHSYYSRREQPFVYSGYTLFVAEVASTLNEALLTHYLLQNTNDPLKKMSILNHQLDSFRTTLFRQTMFAEFEREIHETVESGQALTANGLNEKYYDLNKKYFGPQVEVDRDIEVEWSRVPHFYFNFYVYKYATGFSAAAALSKQILEEGEPAVKRYISFLQGGSSDYSIELLKRAGVDMTSPEPIRQALQVFEHTLDQFEALYHQIK